MERKELDLCFNCDDWCEYVVRTSEEEVRVRDTYVRIVRHRAFCGRCGSEMDVRTLFDQDQIAAFDAYKDAKGLVTAQELIAFRKAIGYSAVKLSRALGLGDKTITRLENGDIQSASVDMLLKFAMGKVKPLGKYKKEIRADVIGAKSKLREHKNR